MTKLEVLLVALAFALAICGGFMMGWTARTKDFMDNGCKGAIPGENFIIYPCRK
jgi:hypothetical protein